MDIRILAKLVASKVGEQPVDLDDVLESLGVDMAQIPKPSIKK